MAYLYQGDHRPAEELLRRTVTGLQGDLVRERFGQPRLPAVAARDYLAMSLADRGEFAEAAALAGEARRIARSVDEPFSICHSHWGDGTVHLSNGDLGRSIPVLERGLEHARTWRIGLFLPQLRSSLGYAYALSGRVAEGLALLELGAAHVRPVYAHALAWLAEAYLLDGRRAEAARTAEQAVAVTRGYKQRRFEANALRMVGEIAVHTDAIDVETAQTHYQRALALADELGMRPLVAHCHLGLGTLYRKIGREEQAGAELTRAAEMYRAMEMTFWLARAEAECARPRD